MDVSTTGVKVMAVDPKSWKVTGYGSLDLDPGRLQDSLNKNDNYLADGIKLLLNTKMVGKLPSRHVVLSVPTNHTYTRSLTIPIDAKTNLEEAVQLEAEQYIPIPVAELYLDYEEIERNDKNITLIMSAVPRRIIDSLKYACEKNGLEIVLMEPGISAVDRIIGATEEGHLPTLLIDIGAATTDIALVDKFIRVAGGVSVGGHTFTLKLSEKLKVDFTEAHQLKVHSGLAFGPMQNKIKSALQPSLDQIVSECRKIIRYYNDRLGIGTKIEQIVIVGGGASLPGLGEFITEAMLMPARVGNPWLQIDFGNLKAPSRQTKERYVTVAGLAIIKPKDIWK